MLAAIRRWFKDNPRTVFVIVVGVVVLGLFLGVVTPLFATAGPPKADLSGVIPSTAIAGRQLEIDVSVDNVGDPVIGQICVGALVQGPLTPIDAIFQNVDKEPFIDGKACGGELTSQSSAPVQLFFDAGSPGPRSLVLSPMNGKQVIGQALTGSLSVQHRLISEEPDTRLSRPFLGGAAASTLSLERVYMHNESAARRWLPIFATRCCSESPAGSWSTPRCRRG